MDTRLTLVGSQILRSLQDRNELHEFISGGVAPLNHRLLSDILIRMKSYENSELQQLQTLNTPGHASSLIRLEMLHNFGLDRLIGHKVSKILADRVGPVGFYK